MELSKYPEDAEIIFEGYREALDVYFGQLFHPELKPEKPVQNQPEIIIQILNYLVDKNVDNRVENANYFLNFSSDAKKGLNDAIKYLLGRQKEIKYMSPVSVATEPDKNGLRYTLFVAQPGIYKLSEFEKRDYILSTIVWNDDPERIMIEFDYDSRDEFISMGYHKFKREDIPKSRVEELKNQGQRRAMDRVSAHLQHHGMISDDEYCPCASGKKYINCCKSFKGVSEEIN